MFIRLHENCCGICFLSLSGDDILVSATQPRMRVTSVIMRAKGKRPKIENPENLPRKFSNSFFPCRMNNGKTTEMINNFAQSQSDENSLKILLYFSMTRRNVNVMRLICFNSVHKLNFPFVFMLCCGGFVIVATLSRTLPLPHHEISFALRCGMCAE